MGVNKLIYYRIQEIDVRYSALLRCVSVFEIRNIKLFISMGYIDWDKVRKNAKYQTE